MTTGITPQPRRLVGDIVGAFSLALSGALAAVLPGTTVVACAALAIVTGGASLAFGWLISSQLTARFAVIAAAVGGASGLALAAFAQLFGPASVAVLASIYAVGAVVAWMLRAPRRC
ncbi:MAG TPA: hypothetical protein VFE65_17550 [Pseudonocardia sp.]|jgi:hypothetical protein|nr:hypothetical protein [Pseudonocardia sp.]